MDWTAVFEPVWTASILPANATRWERVLEGIDGDLTARDPVGLIAAARSDVVSPLELLPYLAIERSVDEYSGLWAEARRREVVQSSFSYHKVKGTRHAIDKALSPLGYNLQVVEWFEPSITRTPYTFRIRIQVGDLDEWLASDRHTVIRVANYAKNLHTKLEIIEPIRRAGPGVVYIGGVTRTQRTILISQDLAPPTVLRPSGFVFVGGATTRRRTLFILPRT
jgi:phage tail P2-like protein